MRGKKAKYLRKIAKLFKKPELMDRFYKSAKKAYRSASTALGR